MSGMRQDFDLEKKLQLGKKQGLRGSLKTGSLLSGSLFIDLDYYANVEPDKGPDIVAGYKVIPTTPGGLNQIQQKIVAIVDKMNSLPLRPLISVASCRLCCISSDSVFIAGLLINPSICLSDFCISVMVR